MDKQQRPPHTPHRAQEIACVPRRFGAGTLLIVTAAFALLLGVLKALSTPTALVVFVSTYFTGIAIAQMIGGPRYARFASAMAGGILLPLLTVVANIHYGGAPGDVFGAFLCACVVFGPLLGLMAGVLVAAIFLLMRYADTFVIWLKRGRVEAPGGGTDIGDQGDASEE